MYIFIYPPSFLRFAFMNSHRDTGFFNNEYSLKLYTHNIYRMGFIFKF